MLFALTLSQLFRSVNAQTITASFDLEEIVCIGAPVEIINTSQGGTTYEWNFCASDVKKPKVETVPVPAGILNEPVYMDYVVSEGRYFAFVTNYKSGDLVRLDFGSSLLNPPAVTNLGNFSNAIPGNSALGGIQVVQDQGQWYAFIVAGYPPGGNSPRLIRLSFGQDITNNTPAARSWENLGMYNPKDFVLLHENDTWVGFAANAQNNMITRLNFSNSLENSPVAAQVHFPKLDYPTGIFVLDDAGVKRMYVINAGSESRTNGDYSLIRLDFSGLLDDTPQLTDLGNISNLMQAPRDLHILTLCDNIYGLVLNADPSYNNFMHLNFLGDYAHQPNGSAGQAGDLFDYPYSFSGFETIDDRIVGFAVNRGNNTISRIVYENCDNSSILISNEKNPPPVSYSAPGMYNIRLTINKGLHDETTYCRHVVMQDCKVDALVTSDTSICENTYVTLQAAKGASYSWSPATYLDDPTSRTPRSTPKETTRYYVNVVMEDNSVQRDSITLTVIKSPVAVASADTTLCRGQSYQLAASGGSTFRWTPSVGLSNAEIPNPVAAPASDQLYRIVVTDSNGCSAEDTVAITVRPYPAFTASATTPVCKGSQVMLTAGGGENYSWMPADLVEHPAASNTMALPQKNVTFQVRITESSCGYDTTISLPVAVHDNPSANTYALPNAFTPNGDGKNDCFGIGLWNEVQVEQFSIYNRWGEAVFQTKSTKACWDGTVNGTPQPSGTYMYIIRALTHCGPVQRRGMITLIR